MPRFLIALFLVLTTLGATAQERPSTILVLDGSGSMWGQIDGINKIVIAREVIGTLLEDFPPDQELGLTVYGHRRKGDCTDIETIIAPGLGTLDAITGAVNSINPKGKTPLSAAVMAAAEALRFTEERATVILVSDGIETCEVDPCAVGRQLEQLGVDFTAHVVGFDVENDPQARAQLQCLAEETGGIFRTASNASELTDALQIVSAPPAPAPVPVSLVATEGSGGPQIRDGIGWTVTNALGIPVLSGETGAAPVLDLLPGDYVSVVIRAEDGARGQASFTVADAAQTVIAVLPELLRPQTVKFQARAEGALIADGLVWQAMAADGSVVLQDDSNARPTATLMPGSYTATVTRLLDGASVQAGFTVSNATQTVILTLPDLPPEPVRVRAFATDGKNGPNIADPLIWDLTGPDGPILSSEQTPDLDLMLPEGTYTVSVLRPADESYAEQRFGVGSVAKTVTLELPEFRPPATLSASATAPMGSTIQVDWTGPNAQGDYISVNAVGSAATRSINYAHTRDGSPLDLVMPPQSGTYEIRYILRDGGKVLASAMIESTPVTATLAPTGALVAGNTISVDWTGPNYQGDYLTFAAPGTDDRTGPFSYTRDGTPVNLQLPADPGTYDMVYVMRQDHTILARLTIEVAEVGATLSAPAQAAAGETVAVDWTGPDYKDDYITFTLPGQDDRTGPYTYTREGTPLNLKMPSEPGSYDIVYIQKQDNKVLGRTSIQVMDVAASLLAPDSGPAGADITVDWTGPDYKDDFIAVTQRGEDGWINYTYTREGSPLDLALPVDPGDYDILYFMSQDRQILARRPITVSAVSATLTPPADLPAGATVQVSWTGPDYKDDFIAVSARGDDAWINYAYTRDGSPLGLQMPPEPGDYDIIYVISQDREVIARTPITVSGIDFSVSAPANAPAGSDVQVAWTGPDYQSDFISVAAVGAPDNTYVAYTYTREGSPLSLTLPPAPGTYEIRYILNQDRTTKASTLIEVAPVTAAVAGPASAPAGSDIPVKWTGPAYDNDYIAIAPAGESDDKSSTYAYTRDGQPATLTMPIEPGAYELRYIMAVNGRTVLAREPITISAVSASLDAPASGPAGGTISVSWTGPDYDRDYVALVTPGERGNVDYFYTRQGPTGELVLPDTPGQYELQYVAGQGRTVLYSQPFTVQ